MHEKRLLEVDGYGNVLLGLPFLLWPGAVGRFLGLAPAEHGLYPRIVGALLVGIGIALLQERYRGPHGTGGTGGLGLRGALAINFTFGVVLLAWQLLGDVAPSAAGGVALWGLAVVLVGLAGVELIVIRPRGG